MTTLPDFNKLEIKPEHDRYRQVEIRVILTDEKAKALAALMQGDQFKPYLFGKVQVSDLLSYIDALAWANHFRRLP